MPKTTAQSKAAQSSPVGLTAEIIGRPWRAERSSRDKGRVIVRRADGAWVCDFDGDNAMAFAELVVAAVNAPDLTDRYVPDIVKNAMLVAWRHICTDTGCHPLDIEHGKRRFLIFEPRHWAQMTGAIVATQIRKLIEMKDA